MKELMFRLYNKYDIDNLYPLLYSHIQILYDSAQSSDGNWGHSTNTHTHIINMFSKYIENILIDNYVDFGCGDGQFANTMIQTYNISNHLLIDIVDTRIDKHLHFGTSLDKVSSKSVNLITAMMSLHHVTNLSKVLQEFDRILKDNGIVVIREHDSENQTDEFNIEVYHHAFDIKKTKNSKFDVVWKNSSTKNWMHLRSKQEWIKLFSRYNQLYISSTTKNFKKSFIGVFKKNII